MSVLSASELRERIFVRDPSDEKRIFIVPTPCQEEIRNASVDLVLGNHFIVTKSARFRALEACGNDTEKDIASYQERVLVPFKDELVVHPGSFILGMTWQYLGLPRDIHAQVGARSTWGRAGLTVATAVVIHPGFTGCLTLELVNSGNAPIALQPGSRLAQIIFIHVGDGEIWDASNASKYAGMTEPSFTRLHDERAELLKWQEIGRYVSFQANGDDQGLD